MDKDEIVAELRRVAYQLGTTTLTRQQFSEHSHIGLAVVEKDFRTWSHAIEAAGLLPEPSGPRPNRQQNISDDEYLQEIIRLTQVMGRHPTYDEMNEKG